MTTILADAKWGLMVADSSVSDEDRVWVGKKVYRVKNALIGMAGNESDCAMFREWYRAGLEEAAPTFTVLSALILTAKGLFFYDNNYEKPIKLALGREAVGTGAKAAMCAYEALGFANPKKAVQIVCKHDALSRAPVRSYNLKAVAA